MAKLYIIIFATSVVAFLIWGAFIEQNWIAQLNVVMIGSGAVFFGLIYSIRILGEKKK